jgi:hypothetical protein
MLGGRHDVSGREQAEQAAECRSLKGAASRAIDAAAPPQTNQQHPCEKSKEQGGHR